MYVEHMGKIAGSLQKKKERKFEKMEKPENVVKEFLSAC